MQKKVKRIRQFDVKDNLYDVVNEIIDAVNQGISRGQLDVTQDENYVRRAGYKQDIEVKVEPS